MKRLLLLTLICTASQGLRADTISDSANTAKAFLELVEACKSGDKAKAAKYILYNGKDEKKNLKVFVNHNNKEDKEIIDEWCRIIRRDILENQQYEITGFRIEKESEGDWHILTIRCTSDGEVFSIGVAFLKVGGKPGLGDID